MRICFRIILLALVFSLPCFLTGCGDESRETNEDSRGPKEVTLTVLETSDVHGYLTNYDYYVGSEIQNGLVKCATVIKQEREKDPDLLLVDCGDISQGNLVSEFRHDPIPPVAKVLNAMRYNMWELGNHDFNFEFSSLLSNINNFTGDVLGGNIYKQDGTRFVKPYVIKNVKGVRVAFIGVDNPNIPNWESDSTHYDNMTFTKPDVEIGKILEELKPLHPDVTIVLAHCGEAKQMGNKGMYEIGADYSNDVAAFLIGHAHSTLHKYYDGENWVDEPKGNVQTCLLETGCYAKNVGKLTLTLRRGDSDGWTIKDRQVELLSCADAAPDPELMETLKDVHERSLAISNRVICEVSSDFFDDPLLFPHIPKAVLGPSALTDLVNKVILLNSEADVSMSTIYFEKANVKAGKFRFKDACSLCRFDDSIIGVKVTGEQLKNIMEFQAGSFYVTPVVGDVTLAFNPKMPLYTCYIFKGIDYEIDVSKPEGQRIQNLFYKGMPLKKDQELVLAVNSFRFSALLNAGYVNEEDIVFDSANLSNNSQILDMLVQYITDKKVIDPEFESNWKIVGYNFDDPQKELIYDMIRAGIIEIPVSPDSPSINIKAINAIELREQGVLPPLD